MSDRPIPPPAVDIRTINALAWLASEIHPRWIVWRYTWNEQRQKWDKPPLTIRARNASSADPRTWVDFPTAWHAVQRRMFDGPGLMLQGLPGEYLAAIDLDDVRDPQTGALLPWAADLVERCRSYVEITPSGTGLRILGTAERIVSIQTRIQHPDGGSFELFVNCNRYITVSGQMVGEWDILGDIADLIDELAALKPQPTNGNGNGHAAPISLQSLPYALQDIVIRGAPGDRSAEFFRVVRYFKACHQPVADIVTLLGTYPAGIAAKYVGRLETEVRRCWGKIEDDPPQTTRQTHAPEPHVARKLALAFGADAAIAPPDQSTVVRGIFHKGSITLIYGLPKSGKSFLATNVAMAVAEGEINVWMGHRIQQHGPVLYVACEGHGGFWKRLKAADHVPRLFVLATGRPMLIHNADGRGYSWAPNPQDILDAIEAVEAHYGCKPVLVIIDTVFRSFGGGNVNDSSHMNAYVAAAQLIADGRCAVGLVHHTTKTGTSPAGSVALMGGADTLLLVEKRDDGSHAMTVEEAKDDASGEAVGFRLEIVNGIIDASGEEVSSCVLVPLEPDSEALSQNARGAGRKPNHKRIDQVMAILATLLNKANGRPVHINHLREAVYHEMLPGEAQDTKRKTFKRDIEKLIAQGRVVATDDMVTVP